MGKPPFAECHCIQRIYHLTNPLYHAFLGSRKSFHAPWRTTGHEKGAQNLSVIFFTIIQARQRKTAKRFFFFSPKDTVKIFNKIIRNVNKLFKSREGKSLCSLKKRT
jgi:hypothetical protein